MKLTNLVEASSLSDLTKSEILKKIEDRYDTTLDQAEWSILFSHATVYTINKKQKKAYTLTTISNELNILDIDYTRIAKYIQPSDNMTMMEVAPYDPKIRKWTEDPKVRDAFKKRYGDKWEKALYATAWKRYNDQLDESLATLSVTDYDVTLNRNSVEIEVKQIANKNARNALHRLAASAYKFSQGNDVVFPGIIGRDSAKALNEIFERYGVNDSAVNNRSYSEYKHTVTDPDDTFADIESIILYFDKMVDKNTVRTLLFKVIAVTKSRLEKADDKVTIDDFVWESTYTVGDSFGDDFEFITVDVYDITSKEEALSLYSRIRKATVDENDWRVLRNKSGSTIFLLNDKEEKSYSLSSNSGWVTVSDLTYSKTLDRINTEKGIREL